MLFTSVEKKSHSVAKSLLDFSNEKKIASSQLDFELLSFDTLVKTTKEKEYKIVEEVSESEMIDPSIEIVQEYTIEIIPFAQREHQIMLSLSINSLKTVIMITIKAGSTLIKNPSIFENLKKEIWKKKLRAGLFIDIFEDKLDEQLEKLFKILPDEGALKKDLKFTVGLAVDPTDAINGELKKIFNEQSNNPDSIITGVNPEDLIAQYTLPQDGIGGRSCTGRYIETKKAKIIDKQPSIDTTVSEKVTEDSIEYFANINGYPAIENNKLKIAKTLKLEEACFKTSGLIDAGDEDNDISVHIGHNKSASEDAIGSGVKIDVKDLHVEGSIAASVEISTQTLNIDAQTHKKSKLIVAETASVKLHRGDLEAKNAHIEILESGKIEASESASIGQMLGGIVIAPTVKIEELMSNTTVIASELIEVKSITGENNKLIINPYAIKSYHDDIDKLTAKIKELEKILNEKKSILQEKILKHSSQIDRIKTFQKRVIQAEKDGKYPMKQDVIRVRQFKKESDKFNVEREELEKENSVILDLEAELDKMYNKDLYAKIKSNTVYDGHTQIVFVNVKTKEEITLRPEGITETISLVLNEDEERVISSE